MRLTIPEGRVDWRTRGIWHPEGPPISDQEFAAARHGLFGGAFTWPLMVARRSALDHNIAELAAFCAAGNLEFAPHGKTTMAPALFEAQLNAGAWGITVATAGQALACRAFGVPRVLLANELLDPGALAWIAGQLDQGWELLLFVDSAAGVWAASGAAGSRPVRVLAELGYPGGRTGCRDSGELVTVARAAAAAPGVELAGVAGYEGGIATVSGASRYLSAVRAGASELADARLLPEEVIVTAGGSAYFDLVAAVPDGTRLAPGDLICFGISHPCMAFDKWPVIPVIDDGYTVTDLIRTYF